MRPGASRASGSAASGCFSSLSSADSGMVASDSVSASRRMRSLLEREPTARVLGIRLLDRLDGVLQAVGGAVRRNLDHEPDVEVAGIAALRIAHPASREAEPLAALAALRDLQPDGATSRRRHVDRRAAHRLADRDRHLEREVLPAPLHEGMRAHLDAEVEIARGTATPRAALPPHADA